MINLNISDLKKSARSGRRTQRRLMTYTHEELAKIDAAAAVVSKGYVLPIVVQREVLLAWADDVLADAPKG